MKKALLTICLMFALIPVSVQAEVFSDYNLISIAWTRGDSQPANIVVTFTNTAEENVSMSISKEGAAADFFSYSPEIVTLGNVSGSTSTMTVIWNIPNNTATDYYYGNITYQPNRKIPVIVQVLDPPYQTQCQIMVTPSQKSKTIYTDALPDTQRFEVRLTSQCVGGVDLGVELLGEVVNTDLGEQPARLKEEGLGFMEFGTVGYFIVEFNAEELETRTYDIRAEVSGIHNDTIVSKSIDIPVTVLQPGSSSANITTLPDYIVPIQVQAGTEFKIEARNMNPNLIPKITLPSHVVGLRVEQNPWAYYMETNESGEMVITIETLEKSTLQRLGDLLNFTINVISGSIIPAGKGLNFDFYPKIDDMRDGDNVSLLVRDNASNNIVSATIFINGLLMENNTFSVEGGEEYHISATNPNYDTADINFTIPHDALAIFITPELPKIGDYITITCKNNKTNEDVNATLDYDGQPLGAIRTITANTPGNHTIHAEFEGFLPADFIFNIAQPGQATFAPEKLVFNETAIITFDKNVSYYVTFSENTSSPGQSVMSGIGTNLTFIPSSAGVYSIYADNQLVRSYVVEQTGWILPPMTLEIIIAIIIIVVGALIIFKLAKRKPGKGKMGYPPSSALSPMG